ncbi:retinitis pigmentosa 9 protein [Rhipicephalus microplus]|uniref:retinitis pigmentosa 9 protein n=1 Tax=Rhipicephalus microplus TaxID=6941 RepID=UPI001887DEE7|nr:retinitis pigmentosa 9 protein homolog [Rhipicephalus microplus]
MSSTKSSRSDSHEAKPGPALPDKGQNVSDKIEALKHIDTFYNQAPPGLIQEAKENPEDCIPDLPENRRAREFLSKAPTKGLWMPLGKQVKVMKCWRCKAYGHRTGDRECPLFLTGNSESEKFRTVHEDPMHQFVKKSKAAETQERIRQLQALLEESSDSDSSSSSSTSDSSEKKSRKRRHKHSHSKHHSKKKRKHHRKSKKKHKK